MKSNAKKVTIIIPQTEGKKLISALAFRTRGYNLASVMVDFFGGATLQHTPLNLTSFNDLNINDAYGSWLDSSGKDVIECTMLCWSISFDDNDLYAFLATLPDLRDTWEQECILRIIQDVNAELV